MVTLSKLKIGKKLSETELKSIKGGGIKCYRLNYSTGEEGSYSPSSWEAAYEWCNFWSSAGYDCRCFAE